MRMSIKERVKDLCKEKGISLNKLEQEIGVASGYLSKLDNPGIKTVKLIADYFNVSVDYLMTGEEKEVPTFSTEHIELISAYDKLSSADKLAIMQIIKSLSEK